ncbi:hypothetical protein SAMN05519103_07242 [Rhizobiales bacterium GAS113]|nr:hypothetical protein SAMN05519103_07242 [Rhizobiales bacterium GAS113]
MSEKISPSKFMRELRPEYYSDTGDRAAYLLETATFEYFLNSLTSRNQTNNFELFARKLCERTICPNLRPPTGPEGGGDGKVDSETYPVADEIAVIYVGEANAGRERWAFAFSTKAKWKEKVRNDVKGIVETGRHYEKIFCVTSQFAKSKDRLGTEQQLSKQYGIPVTIHDRSWIVREIIENDRKDLAFNYLGVGEAKSDPLRLGPTDYSRTQQLTEIEKQLEDAEAFRGMERQRVTEALVAAKLSRNLERPRTDTDGRFLRAARLAKQDGTYRQQLEATYEHVWTAFWWFDDFQFVNDSYGAFETLALESDHARNLEFLSNLRQLLVNSVIHGLMTSEECRLKERTKTLTKALEPMAANPERPNNRLEAQTLLLIVRLGSVFVDNKPTDLPAIWREFGVVLEKARGLGEFDANRLVSMIELAGQVAGNDPAYNDLIEKLAEFVANRKSEAEGALILLRRAQKLDFADHFDMIRLLGKAALKLTKKESNSQLIEALQLLMLAYRSAGLLWAARATCIFAAASIAIEGEEDSLIPVSLVPTMKVWAWLALELRHLPDFLLAVQTLNGALLGLPLTDESKAKLREDIQDLEYALGSVILNLTDDELRALDRLPDLLEALGLFIARSALLYTLGYAETLREDGSFPKEETDEDIQRTLSILASQPIARQIRGPMILNGEGSQTLSTTILGMAIEVIFEGKVQSILAAEAVLGSLEAFFATAIEQRVAPHTEKFRVTLVECSENARPAFEPNAMDLTATLTWPATFSLASFEQQPAIQRFLAELCGMVLATTCVADDMEALLKKLFVDEAAQHRMVMVAVAGNSYHRLASRRVARISDWNDAARTTYPPRTPRPQLPLLNLEGGRSEKDDVRDRALGGTNDHEFPPISDHRAMSVRSVVDLRAWDQARWKGTLYAQYHSRPPCMAFMFENREGARRIFERWRERFGPSDKDEEIYLSVVRHLPEQNRHHYIIMVTSRLPEEAERKPDQTFVVANRSITMEPQNDVNLDRFLHLYQRWGAFYLMPAVLAGVGEPELLTELAIPKRTLSIKEAADVGEGDIEAMALGARQRRRRGTKKA